MSPEEFKKTGYQFIDWVNNYLLNIGEYPVLPKVKPGDIKSSLPNSPPGH